MKVLITGANRGIGLELCRQLIGQGHDILALCRESSPSLRELPLTIEEGVDVRDLKKLKEVATKHQNERFDLLINNAGRLRHMLFETLDFEIIEELFAINTLGPLKVAHTFLPLLAKEAKIAMISSRAGSIASIEKPGRYAYRISKAALNMASAVLAKDLKEKKIAVGIYHPGFVQTDMTEGRGDIDVRTAAENLLKEIEKLTLETSGQFIHAGVGPLPW